MLYRIGFGYDVHRLVEGRPMIIGGVHIASDSGFDGHSDADVLIHAICDALLGAAGLRDIGFHFPDTDQSYKGIDSRKILKQVVHMLEERSYRIGNIDCTLVLEKPKVFPYIAEMKKNLAAVINTDVANISVKATTSEGLGFAGRLEGAQAYAVALIYKFKDVE